MTAFAPVFFSISQPSLNFLSSAPKFTPLYQRLYLCMFSMSFKSLLWENLGALRTAPFSPYSYYWSESTRFSLPWFSSFLWSKLDVLVPFSKARPHALQAPFSALAPPSLRKSSALRTAEAIWKAREFAALNRISSASRLAASYLYACCFRSQ